MKPDKLSIWASPYTYRSKLVYFLISIVPLAIMTYLVEIYIFPLLSSQHQRYLIYGLTSLIYCLLSLSVLGYVILYRDARSVIKAFEAHDQQITKLLQISQSLSSTIQLDVLLSDILDAAVELLKAEAGSLFLYDEKSNYLIFKATSASVADQLKTIKLDPKQGIAGWVASSRKPAIVNDVGLDSRFDLLVDQISGFRTDSILCVPLLFKEQLLGVLEIINKKGKPAFDLVDQKMLQSLASEAAIALKNASYYETLKKHQKHLTEMVEKRTAELERINEQLKQEVRERKEAEEQVTTSLKEKEVLLMEIHHRVKNNLQIISSLLNLQSEYIKDERAHEMFKESQYRVRSMALIHKKLYQSRDLGKIDFAEYSRSLASDLISSYGVDAEVIKLDIKVDDVLLGLNTAIPCGLIINELVSNSLKYAFPSGNKGKININLYSHNDNKFKLIVSDNGVGLPKNFDFRNTSSLGMQLVVALVDQLEGIVEVDRDNGATFKVTFSELK